MLRIIQNSSPAGAKSYYSTSDYYTEGQELVGHWRGEAAKRLGLDGTVAKDDWSALCDNRNPADGTTLTPRQKQNRRVGYDFNFHVPKSVSLLYAFTEDERILDAFKDSVGETMLEMEAEAKARVRKDGQNEDRTTGNLVWGEFVHLTARPEGGVPDPHLHAHCFVFNATYDNEESRWKAAQLGDVKRDAPYFEAVFHSKLARRMEELGLATTRTKHAWELDGIDTSTLDKFSRRTARIERLAEAKGITDPVAKAELGVTTRSRKTEELTMPQLRDLWQDRLDEREAQIIDQLASQIGVAPITRDQTSARQAADWAIEHVFARCWSTRSSVPSARRPERTSRATSSSRT
jgi:conjugative relaxase-like TrwC/TraI family protein